MLEVELKASLSGVSTEALLANMTALGFIRSHALREIDTYFHGNDRDFRQTDEALRLRSCQALPDGEPETLITYKGPKIGKLAKTRTEHETTVGDMDTMVKLLTALGYRPLSPVEKTRTEYTLGQVTLCMDEVKGLGSFLELEHLVEQDGDKDAAVETLLQLLDKLGVPRENLTRKSYLEMVLTAAQA